MVHRLTRRQRALCALYRGEGLRGVTGAAPPRIAVVGAGLAGLAAAHLLSAAGCEVAVFEAGERAGGRIRTEVDRAGRLWELGGEFIDSDHDDMHALAATFGLDLLDTQTPAEARLSTVYRFAGRDHAPAQVDAAFAQLAPAIAADVRAVGPRPGVRASTPAAQRFDRMSIAEYLDAQRMDAWLRAFIEVAYVTVYGGEAGEQSALNLLTLIGTDARAGFEIFGSSDERWKLAGGSQSLTDALAARLGERVHTGCRLVRLRAGGGGAWSLSLDRRAQGTAEVAADAVVLALPFTMLRQVDLGSLLPPVKRRAVDELGYGSGSKLILAARSRFWRDAGCDGGAYSDLPLQTSWDASRGRAGTAGLLTVFLGGREGLAIGDGSVDDQARRFAGFAETLFPGFAASWTGEARRVHWASEPLARGSYTSYRPGQWTAFGGAEATPLRGGVHFAGEHCATGSQGYMNGAAETGRRAAMAILMQAWGP